MARGAGQFSSGRNRKDRIPYLFIARSLSRIIFKTLKGVTIELKQARICRAGFPGAKLWAGAQIICNTAASGADRFGFTQTVFGTSRAGLPCVMYMLRRRF